MSCNPPSSCWAMAQQDVVRGVVPCSWTGPGDFAPRIKTNRTSLAPPTNQSVRRLAYLSSRLRRSSASHNLHNLDVSNALCLYALLLMINAITAMRLCSCNPFRGAAAHHDGSLHFVVCGLRPYCYCLSAGPSSFALCDMCVRSVAYAYMVWYT
jgi:hypothetical protein